MFKGNDAEHLVKIIDGERQYNGEKLAKATMLWQCTTSGCTTPPKPQRRKQYENKLICNTCSNRLKSQNPEILKKRGAAISSAIASLGDKWSEVATKNMASKESRNEISGSMKKFILENKEEAIRIRKKTALENNKKTGFGTSEFGKRVWENLTQEQKDDRSHKATKNSTATLQKEHIDLAKSRYPDFTVLEFGSPDNVYKCPKGCIFLMRGSNFLKRGSCTECAEKSKVELEMHLWLQEILPSIKRNKRVLFLDDTKNGNRALEIDSFDASRSFGVETHGVYYHQEDFVGDAHRVKAELADKWGYKLLQFFEDEIYLKKNIVRSIIKSKLGLNDRVVYGRDCEIVILKHRETVSFLEENHLQGNCKSFLKIGLKNEGRLVSVLTFRKPRNKGHTTTEIARYCTEMGTKVTGGFSKMLKKAEFLLKIMGYDTIGSYSDRRYSNGEIYSSNGFEFKYFTVPDMFWVRKSSFIRYPREISWGKSKEEMSKYYTILGTGHSYWEKNI